jgi:GGDEF domain-containing protein
MNMGEADLVEIEGHIEHYPPQARHDILRLTSELRRLSQARGDKQPRADSPLYDAATGLLNAGAYGVRFAMARARATRYRKLFAVMSVDVDMSRCAGPDREPAIREVASRLEGCVRATDTLARIGEHNFSIILEDLVHSDHAERVKQNVQDALDAPMRNASREVVAQSEVRLRFYPDLETDAPVTYNA